MQVRVDLKHKHGTVSFIQSKLDSLDSCIFSFSYAVVGHLPAYTNM